MIRFSVVLIAAGLLCAGCSEFVIELGKSYTIEQWNGKRAIWRKSDDGYSSGDYGDEAVVKYVTHIANGQRYIVAATVSFGGSSNHYTVVDKDDGRVIRDIGREHALRYLEREGISPGHFDDDYQLYLRRIMVAAGVQERLFVALDSYFGL